MIEIRCGACRRKLGEGEYTVLAIKCPRCGAMNHLRAASPPSERQGAPNDESVMHVARHLGCTQQPHTGRQGPIAPRGQSVCRDRRV
ncbi:Com family DNA-binding transcriptional regulator [Acidovorax sp. SUPP1855]|uniref:Com family DNA-binding transcriptional regulator n=1 Tax=Acidovorax sp. SUPP1855 TaxID=431774 RepID=UPI0024E0C9B9|nr:Com family DNA-binding transcriptional regulator [Acidovorax sp. SUPP1855]